MSDTSETTHQKTIELLAFRVASQEYAVDIMVVREIRGWSPATPLPHAPSFVSGVINLRGAVLPIVDLSARLGMNAIEANPRNVVIVMQFGDQTVGVLVDAVSDILTLPSADIQPPPDVTQGSSQGFISGLAILNDRMIRLVNLAAALPASVKVAA